LSKLTPPERDTELSRLLLEESKYVFDLSSGPLVRYGIVKSSADEHMLIFTMHHIVGDGWSLGILFSEFGALYKAFLDGSKPSLAPLDIQYPDYAAWQREYLQSEVMESQLAYWRKQLAGVSEALEFPTDHPRTRLQTTRGAYQRLKVCSVKDKLKKLGDRSGATLFMTVLAAFQVLFSRYTGQTDIVVGSPIAGRTRRETEPLIGNFLNTLVLRNDLSGNPTFQELLSRVKETTLQAYSNQDVPFEKLVEELQPERDMSRTPLFQTLFILQNMPMGLPGESLIPLGTESSVARYGLTVELGESGQDLDLVFEYNTDLYEASTIERMMRHYGRLLEQVSHNGDSNLADLQFMDDAERSDLFASGNDTAIRYSSDSCLHQLFESQVESTPNKVAVVCAGKTLTYRQLDERANQLARFLMANRIAPGDLVAIMTERSTEMVVALLGVLKAGASYLPLDPVYPPDRIAFMLHDSATRMVLTQETLLDRLPATEARIVCLDREWRPIADQGSKRVASEVQPSDLAYVIYTSGSMGQPKGVMIEHRSLVNFLESMKREPGLTANDALVAVTTLSFDIAGLELYLPLITGAQLHIASRAEVVDANALHRLMETSKATVMQATPATWRMLVESGKTMQQIKALCGGEALTRELAIELTERTKELWNMYGPTETTIWSSVHRVERVGETPFVELGHPIANTQFHVLDEHKKLVPPGVAGELYIGGDGLARGYLNRPELTAEKFVPNPLSDNPESRLYRTGDRVRRLRDGRLLYIERVDNQVKIRGYRVETGDVEAVLQKHESVKQAVVVAREEKTAGEKRLIAYVVGKEAQTNALNGNGNGRALALVESHEQNGNGHQPGASATVAMLTAGEWRKYLREFLPDYMVPSSFVVLDDLPLTPNGKIDRKRLPLLTEVESRAEEFQPPSDSLELQLVKIWERVLGLPRVGINDNFFDLGGHSLLAVRLFMEIEQVFEKSLPLAVLFQAPTVEQLATVLREKGWTSSWSSLVPLRSGGSAPPFFCVHSLGANLVSYRSLAGRMDSDQPFYGLQPAGLDGEGESHARIEEMASHYLKEIRGLQPAGPYLLGGVCLGGTIAFEMAQQLKRSGEEVALLALIDSYRPGAIDYMPKIHWQGLPLLADYHLGSLLLRDRNRQLQYGRERARNLYARLRRALKLGKSNKVGSIEQNLRRVYEANSQAERYYKPQRYPGKITLLWSSETATRSYLDRRLHWSELATEGLEVHAIPGDHMSMIEEPHVKVLAGTLQSVIRDSMAVKQS
jgi:amino acid adenylation domain-containing protein